MPSNCCRRGGRSTEHGSPKQFFGKYDTKRARTTNSVQGRIESVHNLVYPRRATQGNIRSVHEEHLLLIHEGPLRTPFVVDSSRLAAMMGYWQRGGFSGGFQGGVAGGVPPHKGGPQAPDRPRWATATGGACGAATASPEPPSAAKGAQARLSGPEPPEGA